MKYIRKINMIIAALLIILILGHGIMGSFTLLGVGSHAGVSLAKTGLVLLIIHAVIGCILTGQTISAEWKSRGKLYLRENGTFWVKRLTGLAILFLAYFHLGMFTGTVDGNYVLLPFTTVKLIAMLALIAAVSLHIFVNIRSLLISMGILTERERRMDILVFLSVILVFMAVAIVLYYISWCI